MGTKHGKGWRIRWWDEKSLRRSETVHTDYKTACLLQRQHENNAEEIRREVRAPSVDPKTFNDLADYYKIFFSEQKRNFRADRTNIELHLRPYFGKLKLHEIGPLNIAEYSLQKQHLNRSTLHKQLTLLGTMLRVALDNNWLQKIPRIKKPKIILLDKNFRYLRTDEEIARLLIAARADDMQMAYYLYATAIYTGMRAGELAGLNRDDIDLQRNLITIQRSYNGPTKNWETRHVPILSVLRPLLAEWLLQNPLQFAFPNEYGNRLGSSARVFQEIFHRTLDRAKFPKEERRRKLRRYVTFHDLRHSFASHWMMKGGDVFRLQKILGHKSITMTMRYSHLSPHAFEGDLDRFGSTAPGSGTGAVIPLNTNMAK